MPKTLNVSNRPIRAYVYWRGKRKFVRLKAGASYTVVPDKDWPKGGFPVSQQTFQISESFYKQLTGAPDEPKPKAAKEEPKEAPPAKKSAPKDQEE